MSPRGTPDTSGAVHQPAPDRVAAALHEAHRREWGFVLASTVRLTRDLDLAEECVQEAYAKALLVWGVQGIPTRPGAWLTTTSRHLALDQMRREATLTRLLPKLVVTETSTTAPTGAGNEAGSLPDERLSLIATCCHPALEPQARVGLTLRFVCGLSTAEVARAFLVKEATMAARITRAKKKIALARIPYREPTASELPERLAAVLDVVHLVFTTGHTAAAGPQLMRLDLVERAVDLVGVLRTLLPTAAEVMGLHALIVLTDARTPARLTADGGLVLLADQDRTLWDQHKIAQGLALVAEALRTPAPGRFVLQATIAAVHAEAPSYDETDWATLLGLYDLLQRQWDTPVVALARAVAVAKCHGANAGLAALETLSPDPRLATYPYLAAARSQLLSEVGRHREAHEACAEALVLTDNEVERRFLAARLEELSLR